MIKTTTILTALFISVAATSQITITSADMPNPGDAIRVSLTGTVGTINPATTGANHTWNYSTLTPVAQRQEIFAAPSTFVTPYNLLFNVLNTSYGKDNYSITSLPIPGVQVTAAYDFFKESTTDLRQIGAGYVVNAIPIPFLYTNASYDRVYKFPMNYLNVDSSTYSFGLPLPGIGYYGQTAKRVNTVDGWGTLTTPYGTFQTLRVKSAITATDTIFLTSLGLGSKIPRPLKYEFKWMGLGQKIPLLQVDANSVLGTLTVIGVVYIDSLQNVPQVGINELVNENYNIQIYPNPAIDKAIVSFELAAQTDVKISVFDILGKVVSSEKLNNQSAGMHFKELIVDTYSTGVYFVKIEINNSSITKKLIVN